MIDPLVEWFTLKSMCEEAKQHYNKLAEKERALRDKIVADNFKQDEGTQYKPLESGWRLKAVLKMERKVDQEACEKILASLGETVFKKEYKLNVAEYRKLTDQDRKLVDSVVTCKYAAPTLELVPPSEET